MSFLTPAFFIGLLAIGIPILVHLTQKEKKTIIDFPSLMFLRQVPYTSVRRRSIRDIWLLLLRIAALLLMVLAFSRPWFSTGSLAASLPGSTREVVILLDRSASMGYGDRWSKAQGEAKKIVDGLSGQDRATLVLFGASAEENVRGTTDRVRMVQAIDAAKVGAQATRFGPALRLAQSILAQSAMPRREVVLISDFQKIGWEKQEDIHLPEGATLTPVTVATGETADIAVTSMTFARNQFSGQDRVTATAGVVNRSAKPVTDVAVSLEIDGHAVDTKKVNVAANGTASVAFVEFTVADANVRGKVAISVAGATGATSATDNWAADNAFFFVLSPGRPVSVLVVQGDNADRDASLYLATALGIGESPKFDVETIAASKLSGAQVEKRAVVILNDVAVLPTGGADVLKRFVERGGGLLVGAAQNAKWTESEQTALMPGVLGAPVDRPSGRVGALGFLDYSHPVFELFRTPRAGSFSGVHFFRYRALDPKTNRVLARFDDGAAALVERKLGGGRVLAWSTSFDSSWNDLVTKPAFLPFVRQVATF
ncbi:MAG: BatA and WFA domain-containing protein, partial [Acidobacteria bacterium]|nr:BatA and WFA domain-containing protein [Acidobacteriota bacterium]